MSVCRMRAVLQRVKKAEVRVCGRVRGQIGSGLLVFLGIGSGDREDKAQVLAQKITGLRMFDDQSGRMNLSVIDVNGAVLCVPQFTLYGDCRKGRRPNYDRAATPEVARPLYEFFVECLRNLLPPAADMDHPRVATGEFQARMEVDLINDGPVTLLLDSERLF